MKNKKGMKIKSVLAMIMVALGAVLSLYLVVNLDRALNAEVKTMPTVDSILEVPVPEMIALVMADTRMGQLYLVLTLAFSVFGLFLVFGNKKHAHYSELITVAPEIQIPAPVGQNQHGSAWFLPKKKYKKAFNVIRFSAKKRLMKELLRAGEKDQRQIREGEWRDAKPLERRKTTLFKEGGIVLGKKNVGKHKEINYCVCKDVHTLVVGATRSGKSRCLVLQTLGILGLSGESMLTVDPKGELYNYVQPFLKRLHYAVMALDFKNPLKSARYNFLQPIIDAVNENAISEAVDATWNLVKSLVGEAKGEKIWNQGEASIIATCILAVVFDNKESPQFQNLTNVYYFICEMCKVPTDKKDQMAIIKYMNHLKEKQPEHPAIGLAAISEIAPERTRGSFYTAALTTLNLFTNPLIYSMTCTSDFNPKDIGQEKTALFIILPDEKSTYYSLASLFCSQNYAALVKVADSLGGRLPIRTNFILDEFGNFTEIPDFTKQLTVGGGRGIRLNLFVQDFAQLEKTYGKEDAKTTKGNCENWIYLQSNDQDTREEISKRLGEYTTSAYSVSSSQQAYSSGSSSQSVNLIGRRLLNADEVGRIKRPYSLVTSGSGSTIMYAPDLSEWHFNTLYGMGDPKHNTELRKLRENSRPKRKEEPISLWGIWTKWQAEAS